MSGCDSGNPEVDRNVGRGEVVVGRTAQQGGQILFGMPDPRAKAAGVAAMTAGHAIELDGRERIARAEGSACASLSAAE